MQFFPVFYLTLVLALLPCTSGRAQRLLLENTSTLRYEQHLLHLQTDRTLYTNFETVHFKAYLDNGFGDDRHSITDEVCAQLLVA